MSGERAADLEAVVGVHYARTPCWYSALSKVVTITR